MNKHTYKSAMGKVKASAEFKKSMTNTLENSQEEGEPMKRNRMFKSIVAMAAMLALVIGTVSFYQYTKNAGTDVQEMGNPSNGVVIPQIKLPEQTNGVLMDMIGLIVYNGKIYTQTGTQIDAESAKQRVGTKLGTTKGNLDEWSKQDAYSEEFASSIGKEDVYTVKGYDKNFRIMTYTQYGDGIGAQFYECLNGITITSGQDIFGKLKIGGNVASAKYRGFDDWNNDTQAFHTIPETQLLDTFVNELNNTTPYPYQNLMTTLEGYRNEEGFRNLTLTTKDGCEVTLNLFKNGYIAYSTVYFKMESKAFEDLWNQLDVQ